MTKKSLSVILMTTILMTSAILASTMIQDASAADRDTKCRAGEILVFKYNANNYICTSPDTAQKWVGWKMAEIIPGSTIDSGEAAPERPAQPFDKTSESILPGQLEEIMAKIERGEKLSTGEIKRAKKAMMEEQSQALKDEIYRDSSAQDVAEGTTSGAQNAFGRTNSGTITSGIDPGVGHEGHQIAILLPPSDNAYIGRVSFSASEQVQFVTIHGPISPEDDNGQATWSPDGGETVYALTFIDNGLKSGGWFFAGNALALHTMHDTPFSASWSAVYSEVADGVYPKGTVSTGTVNSVQDPGNEEHSIALILPPREIPYQGGVISYAASENIELVAFIGPLAEHEILGQEIWTQDGGETNYAIAAIPGDKAGVWNTFAGNALAFRTLNSDGFTATYTLGGLH